VVVLPETTKDGAMELAERLRHLVEMHTFEYEGKKFHVAISLGVYATLGDVSLTPSDLLREADLHLFEAKKAGRNRVYGALESSQSDTSH
jgi:diguanylate cyclase (GGDEF)-like protein